MKRLAILALMVLVAASVHAPTAMAAVSTATGAVHIVPVKGTVTPGLAAFIDQSINRAGQQGAKAVVLEIDTLGGLVEAALNIRDSLLASPVPVHALVKGRAWSAGALITLACRKIVMTPGSSIGSAEPRPADAKSISAVRAEFEATAEARGRDKQVAAAMVDQSIVIEGVKDKGQLLNLTASRARELGIADAVVESRDEALSQLGLTALPVVEVKQSLAEEAARAITDPSITGLLILVGVVGLVVEVVRPGFGVPGVIGLLSLATLVIGRSVSRLAGSETALLFMAGLLLLSIEAFIPGFGVLGFSGIALVIVGIVLSARAAASPASVVFSLALALLAVAAVFRYASKKGMWAQLSLNESMGKTSSEGALMPVPGQEGIAVTDLRPSGTAQFEARRISVVTRGEFVALGTPLVVESVAGNRIVVRPKNVGQE